MAQRCAPSETDWARNSLTKLLLWQLPAVAVAGSALVNSPTVKTTVWTAAFTQMGLACLANTSRCGRLHCYFTGPFFLGGAIASLLRGLAVVRLPWVSIALTMLVGGVALGYLPEKAWGQYTERP